MPNIVIHLVSNIALILSIYYYEKIKLKIKPNVKFISLLIFSSNLIDIDHLLANPIYDSSRCSINFHPLHSWYMFPIYAIGIFIKKYRYLFMGIILHLILDGFDCLI